MSVEIFRILATRLLTIEILEQDVLESLRRLLAELESIAILKVIA